MGTEQQKSEIELAVFSEFVNKAKIAVNPKSISKPGTESEPDIFCTFLSGEEVAYELVEICSTNIAATLAKLRNGDVNSAAFSTSDPTERLLQQKLHKFYKTLRPIELLCYTNGRTVSPDDQILAEAQGWANSIKGRFRKIWLLGEKGVYEVWSAS